MGKGSHKAWGHGDDEAHMDPSDIFRRRKRFIPRVRTHEEERKKTRMNTACSSRAIHLLTGRSRTLLAVGLLALVMVFSAFSFAPSAHAASRQGQTVVPACSFTLLSSHNFGPFTINAWRDSCGGTVHGELIANVFGTFELRIWGNISCSGTPQQTVGPADLRPGGILNTREFNDGNNWCLIGTA